MAKRKQTFRRKTLQERNRRLIQLTLVNKALEAQNNELLAQLDNLQARRDASSVMEEQSSDLHIDVRRSALQTATDNVLGHDEDYGHPKATADKTALLMNVWNHDIKVRTNQNASAHITSAFDYIVFRIFSKLVRLAQTPGHFDSWSDIAGYAANGAEVTGAVKK